MTEYLLPAFTGTRRADLGALENRVLCCDALELLRQLPDASVDLIVTDPPYGINQDRGMKGGGKRLAEIRIYNGSWDSYRPSKDVFDLIIKKSKHAIIFGGNYFADILPQANHWIVWDKLVTMPSYSKCELIWTNFDFNTVQKITYQQNGFIGGIKNRIHATQKPIEVISQLIDTYSDKNDIICDPFTGSGTTAVAARNLGRKFIGCDLSPEYVALANRRLVNSDPMQDTVLPDGTKQLSLLALLESA